MSGGRVRCKDGQLEAAEASLVEGLTIAGDITDPHAAVEALEGFAELAAATHALQRTATLLGSAARLRDEMGFLVPLNEEREHARLVAAARTGLGEDAFDRAWREGGAMDLKDALRYALGG